MSESSSWPLEQTAYDHSKRRIGSVTIATLASLALLTGLFGYAIWIKPPNESLLFGWTLTPLDWLFLYALVILLVGFCPLIWRQASPRLLRAIIRDRRALFATAFLLSTAVLGFAGPVVYGSPADAPTWVDENPRQPAPNQPPIGMGIDRELVAYCSGPTSGNTCFGTLIHPLGTTIVGDDVLAFVFIGMRVTTKFLLVGAMLMVPLAIGAGVTAGTVGGRLDSAIMRYVDIQQSLPLFLLIIIMLFIFGTNFWPILVVFGLFNWGSMARTIRSETKDVLSAGYLQAAESAGAPTIWTIRRHILPNVVHTITVAVGARLSLLILLEALLTYLGLADLVAPSYGLILTTAIEASGSQFPTTQWWSVASVTIMLAGTVVALNVAGDAYRDILSPKS